MVAIEIITMQSHMSENHWIHVSSIKHFQINCIFQLNNILLLLLK